MSLTKASIALGAIPAYLIYKILRGMFSPAHALPGPESPSWFWGNLKQIMDDNDSGLVERWVKKHGRTMKWNTFLGGALMFTTDPKAIRHFYSHPDIYQKPESVRFSLSRVVGPGVLVTDGDAHRKQRKIMLRDAWVSQVNTASTDGVEVEVLSWLGKAALDIIGLAGFNHDIGSLHSASEESLSPSNELVSILNNSVTANSQITLGRFLQIRYPALRPFLEYLDKGLLANQRKMNCVGRALLNDAKAELSDSGHDTRKDLLSLLVKANTSKDVAEKDKMSEEEVIAQVPTFLVAGHETTSTAVAWALLSLSQHPHVQARLRQEALAVSTDQPSMDELNGLPYLDCVVRETLRLHSPVPNTNRLAEQDDVVPLETPYKDRYGKVHNVLHIKKGQAVILPILAPNRDSEIWGPDAMEFVPERWGNRKAGLQSPLAGVWGDMLTFLGGSHSCIGFRFALIEMKAMIFTLIRTFEFDLAVLAEEMGQRANMIVMQPVELKGGDGGNRCPLKIRLCEG
ncbi:unnamed protein product [Mycena citricolor]|uniref:Cytochrome P450 n=1 Tax=Mycena citricolor TaxID=2018698 RepID=A0AAD2H6M0_9AGAR|nr:unnamed protein product [Mycena citricolor]